MKSSREYIIDCSVQPFCPDRWEILPPQNQVPTRFQASLTWNKEQQKEALYLSEKQMTGQKWVHEGYALLAELIQNRVVVLPANVLDDLLANPHLIPEEWKCKAVFFWGTVYRGSGGNLCVRYLCWRKGVWCWRFCSLGCHFRSRHPAALLASQN